MKKIIQTAILLLISNQFIPAESNYVFGPIGIDILQPVDGTSVPVESFELTAKYRTFKNGFINRSQIQVFIDNHEISWLCTIIGNTITFIPDEDFKNRFEIIGDHTFRIVIEDKRGLIVCQEKIRVHVSVRDRSKKQTSGKRGYVRLTGSQDDSLSGACLLSYESGNRFIQNRNFVLLSPEHTALSQPVTFINTTFEKDDIVRLTLGDFFPDFHELVLHDSRIRGVQVNTNAFFRNHRIASFDMAYGLLRTGDENLGFTGKGVQDLGIYKRRAFSVKPAIGFGDYFNAGFMLFKSFDDINSIELEHDAANRLTNADTPKDNLAVGVNAYSRFLNNRVKIYGNWAAGIYTDDTRGGVFTDEQLATFGVSHGNDYYRDNEYLLIMNSTTSHLSLDVNDIRKEISSFNYGVSYDFRSNYFNGVSALSYIYHGPAFLSFGLNGIPQRARKGLVVSERVNILENMIELNYDQEFLSKDVDPYWPEAGDISQSDFSIKYRPGNAGWYTDAAYHNRYETFHTPLSSISTTIDIISLRTIAPVNICNTKNAVSVMCQYRNANADKLDLRGVSYSASVHSDFGQLPFSGYAGCSRFEDYLENSNNETGMDVGFNYKVPRYPADFFLELKTLINNGDNDNDFTVDGGVVITVLKKLDADIHLSLANDTTAYMSLTLDYNLDTD